MTFGPRYASIDSVVRSLKIAIGLLLLFSVLLVFVSPYVDLDPTALRAAQAALVLVLSIAVNAFLLFCLIRHQAYRAYQPLVADPSPGSLVDLICARLC